MVKGSDGLPGLAAPQITAFIEKHRLPAQFANVITEHYRPLENWIKSVKRGDATEIVGISGAQGTGKSTLADFLCMALETESNWSIAKLSLDDFYLTRSEREKLGAEIHPLLRTRGAPGTHDLTLASGCLSRLTELMPGETMALPRFDKANDDRFPENQWDEVVGPIDLVIFEGWCIGSRPQESDALTQPVNQLEASKDPTGEWREYVNAQLRAGYAGLFERLDRLVFLKPPDFDAVFGWRLEQEIKLAAAVGETGSTVMNEAQVTEFVQHYERISRANIDRLPGIADVTLELDRQHQVVESRYRKQS